jgi:hypothetical protein
MSVRRDVWVFDRHGYTPKQLVLEFKRVFKEEVHVH